MPVLPSQSAIWLVLVSLLSAPCHLSLAAFHYRAVAARLPRCHCFWQIIIKMTLSHCELDSQVQENRHTQSDRQREALGSTHSIVFSSCKIHTGTSHRVNSGLRTGGNGRINGYLYFIIVLYCLRIMHHSPGDTGTYVSSYPLANMI